MFRQLRAKLTVLYAALFGLALLLISASTYFAIARNTASLVEGELTQASTTFARYWSLRLAHLEDGAEHFAQAHGLGEAARSRDNEAIAAALDEARVQTDSDLAFLITREGLIISENGARTSISPGLQIALQSNRTAPGLVSIHGELFQAALAPLPEQAGWLVVGDRLDARAMTTITELSQTQMQATVLARANGGWGLEDGIERGDVALAIGRAITTEQTQVKRVRTADGPVLIAVSAVPAIDGAQVVILLRSSLSDALWTYGALLGTLVGIGIVGLILVVAGSWFLSRGITQPLSMLEQAARRLREGVYEAVTVTGRDELSRLAEAFNAMTGAIRERERRIAQLAFHDAETRLPTRAALERRLNSAQQPERLYLAAIGIDRFSHVRGAIGYALTAELMRKLGGRLARLVPNAPIARLSSDVLGVAFLAANESDALKRARALIGNLEQPVSLGEQVVDVHVVIGVAQPADKGETSAAMIERASIALDQTRRRRQKAGAYDHAAYGDPARNLSLMGEMRAAIESGAMMLAYQPKYNFRTGRIDSAECLVRWRHPTRGEISPDLFVPMAEKTGHVRALTEWVLERAARDQEKLANAGRQIELGVNISARLLSDDEFAKRAAELVKQAPYKICFEITETAVVDDPQTALEHIEMFASNGVHIAIDDYGSGLSSLAYLKQLPAQELKIDKLFVQSINDGQRDAWLVRSTVELAHGLGMRVTAEGVETPAAFALLAGMNCDLAQGFLISRPITLEEFTTLLGDEKRLRFYRQAAAGQLTLADAPASKTA